MKTPLEYYMEKKGISSIKDLSDEEIKVLMIMCDYMAERLRKERS